jgi:hypothetical protein
LKYWGEYKSLDSYLADFYALKREQGEDFPVFNRRFYNIYYDMPLEIAYRDNFHDILCYEPSFTTYSSPVRKEFFILKELV